MRGRRVSSFITFIRTTCSRKAAVALFRRNAPRSSSPPPPETSSASAGVGPATRAKKDRPTPSRREAEAARRQRVNRTLSKREARIEASRRARQERLRSLQARESSPEKALMRDFVDSRLNIGEFLLPSLIVLLAASFLGARFPAISAITTLIMYLFILAVIFDCFFMWRRFKRLLAERLPNAPLKGLAMYGTNRAIQIRRFRIPPPRLQRGERI
jgi:hypothetical protein